MHRQSSLCPCQWALGYAGTLTFDLLTPKHNKFIFVPRFTSDKVWRIFIKETIDIAETASWTAA